MLLVIYISATFVEVIVTIGSLDYLAIPRVEIFVTSSRTPEEVIIKKFWTRIFVITNINIVVCSVLIFMTRGDLSAGIVGVTFTSV